MTLGTVKAPTPAQLRALAEDLGFDMSETDLATFGELMRPSIDAYNAVDRMARILDSGSWRDPKYAVRGKVT